MHCYQRQAPGGKYKSFDNTLKKIENENQSKILKKMQKMDTLPQIARPKTETMQYIVLFSHLTVQLPVIYSRW